MPSCQRNKKRSLQPVGPLGCCVRVCVRCRKSTTIKKLSNRHIHHYTITSLHMHPALRHPYRNTLCRAAAGTATATAAAGACLHAPGVLRPPQPDPAATAAAGPPQPAATAAAGPPQPDPAATAAAGPPWSGPSSGLAPVFMACHGQVLEHSTEEQVRGAGRQSR